MPETFPLATAPEVHDAHTLAWGDDFGVRLVLLEQEAKDRGHLYAAKWYRRQVGTDGRLNDARMASIAAYHAAMAIVDV